jgi:carboxyl-terminal processing protease
MFVARRMFVARLIGAICRCGLALSVLPLAVQALPAQAASSIGSAPTDRSLYQESRGLFASAFRQIREFYLDPVSLETLAVAGIAGLDAADHSFMAGESDHFVTILEFDRETSRMPAPRPDDADGWAEIVANAIVAARNHSHELTQATDETLFQRVFDGVTAKLDRFSRYAGRDQARDQRAARDGFGGIGVTLDYSEPTPRISSIVPDGPSAKAGVRVDDRISAIDDIAITRLNQEEVVAHLRGALNSRVTLTILRPQVDRPLSFTLVRNLIVQPTVTTERLDGVAIFHVEGFNVQTATDLGQEVRRAKAEMGGGLKGAVLDLRGNPGGLLDQAAAVASLFLDRGDIVSTVGRHPTASQYFAASAEDRLRGIPLVVLINGGSASASEIVAAALADNGRAVVVGSSSYGKGTVQMVLRLENNGELTLTWAKLIAPSGYVLHGHGVVPSFCTSHPVDPTAPPEEPEAQLHRILDTGLHAVTTDPAQRGTLPDAGWAALRAACPADTRDPSVDLKVAEAVLADQALYAHALSPPAESVARAGHAPATPLH